MLGRQQIASLSTALSELFKNSHDAYATEAQADLYRAQNILTVVDNGIGMDSETFKQTWLTIATESKLNRQAIQRPKNLPERRQLGEKGIGRFAIGALGSQVLVISKRLEYPAIAALVNWKLFELPLINLEDVPVGLLELRSTIPSADELSMLKAPFFDAVRKFHKLDTSKQWKRRLDDVLDLLEQIPEAPYDIVAELSPVRESGTQFIITPVSEDLSSELETRSWGGSLLNRTLQGFTDVWLHNSSAPEFSVDFVEHPLHSGPQSLLAADDFFEARDFEIADHYVEGRFDEYGTFSGRIRIFDTEPVTVEILRPKTVRREPGCGPFSFELGVIQGLAKETRLEPESYTRMKQRLRQFGGVYVYMDGIRVQPYGRPDVDYLELEERRTRGAGYYYFSYRNMFGAVTLTSEENGALEEKAGREGFTRGYAFSDFRRLMINLFEQLAARFFRADSPHDAYEKGRERLRTEHRLRKERAKRAALGRKRLRSELALAVKALNDTDYQTRASRIVARLDSHLDGIERLQPASVYTRKARAQLRALLKPLRVSRPRGFALTEPMRRDVRFVERGLEDVEAAYIRPALKAIDKLAAQVEIRLGPIEADIQERQQFIEGHISMSTTSVEHAEKDARSGLEQLEREVSEVIRGVVGDYRSGLTTIATPSRGRSGGWIQEQLVFESRLEALRDTATKNLDQARDLVNAIRLIFTTGAPTPSELAAAADAEILELRSRMDAQLELVQLGMALAVVDHEFQATIASIRKDVVEVGRWARVNPDLGGLYGDLRRDFDHLDSYLTLLTPMQRRLRRTKTVIDVRDIVRFLNELFHVRLNRVKAVIHTTREFRSVQIRGFTSTFYPVFINLVDNSLYWFEQEGSDTEYRIDLSTRWESLIYSDNGPGIADDIADRVFDFGFTTRPGGSGLGLAIARQVLDRAQWSIRLGASKTGVEFIISPKSGAIDGGN